MRTVLELLLLTTLCGLAVVLGLVFTVRWAARRARRAVVARLSQVLPGRSTSAPLPLPVAAVPARVASAARVHARAAVPGAGRDVAVVRRDLRRDVAGTTRAVAAARAAGRPVASLETVIRRLGEQAQAVDVDLLVVGAKPDTAVRRRLLAAQAERVALLQRACGQVRRGVVLAGESTTAPLLAGLLDELEEEVIALGLRAAAHRELSGL